MANPVARTEQRRDLLVAALVTTAVEFVIAIFQESEPYGARDIFGYHFAGSIGNPAGRLIWFALGASAASLAFRRRAPLTVLGVTGGATLAAMVLFDSPGPIAIGPLVALYTVATCYPRAISLTTGWVTLCGATAGVAVDRSAGLTWPVLALPSVIVVVPWLIGDNVRVRRAYVASLEERAARAEADRLAEAERAAAGERARIARELHDVVAHHVSVIAIQAAGARVVAEATPVPSGGEREAFVSIESTARQVLTELRRLLGVLRRDDAGAGTAASLEPQPSIGSLSGLIETVRAAGLPVDWRIEGDPVPLASSIELSAYRIVQEALTNVLKHEGQVPTEVIVRYGEDHLDVRIVDTPHGPDRPAPAVVAGSGHGITGMRERVALFGGKLDVGRRPDGTFSVVATLPFAGGTQ